MELYEVIPARYTSFGHSSHQRRHDVLGTIGPFFVSIFRLLFCTHVLCAMHLFFPWYECVTGFDARSNVHKMWSFCEPLVILSVRNLNDPMRAVSVENIRFLCEA